MMPLVEQIYFTLLKGSSSRTIHIKLRDEIVDFLKEYKAIKGLFSVNGKKSVLYEYEYQRKNNISSVTKR